MIKAFVRRTAGATGDRLSDHALPYMSGHALLKKGLLSVRAKHASSATLLDERGNQRRTDMQSLGKRQDAA